MKRFVKGDVVVVPFPFSDLSDLRRRPALVVADLKGDDFVLCQITTAIRIDPYVVALRDEDFGKGSLPANESFIRMNKIFTADISLILYKRGSLKSEKIHEVEQKLIEMFTK
jgi:mRNA interferase MazF